MRYEQTLLPGWQDWSGIGGRITPERVAALRRNQWQDWAGIRKDGVAVPKKGRQEIAA